MIAGRGIPCRVRGKLRVPRAFISYTLGQLRSIDRFRTVETVETAEAVETVQTVQTAETVETVETVEISRKVFRTLKLSRNHSFF